MFRDFRRCSLVFLDFRLCSFIFVDVCRFPQIFRRCQWILSDFRWLSYCRGHGSKNDRSWPKLAPDYTEPQNTHLDINVWIYTDFRPRRQWSNYCWLFEIVKLSLTIWKGQIIFDHFGVVKYYVTLGGHGCTEGRRNPKSQCNLWAKMATDANHLLSIPIQNYSSRFSCSDDKSVRKF